MIEKWFEPFMLLDKHSQPDSLGGERITFSDDVPFSGVLTWAGETPGSAAERLALQEAPALLHEFDVTLSPGDHVRREKDGAVYKVLSRSGSLRAPSFSGLRFCQVPVERVVFPC